MKNLQEDAFVAKTRITWRRFSWEILFKFHLGSKFERASPLTAVWDNTFVSLEVFLKQGSCGVLLLGATNMTAKIYENLAFEKSISGCCSINLKKRMKEMKGWMNKWMNEWMQRERGRGVNLSLQKNQIWVWKKINQQWVNKMITSFWHYPVKSLIT